MAHVVAAASRASWGVIRMPKQRNVAAAKAAPNGAGNIWTFTALQAETKLMVSWMVGSRYGTTAYELLSDLKERVTDRFQLTTDGFPAYADAVRAYPLSPLVRFSAHLGSEE
jgi:hypothetical protein